ncbi:conserved hypothetical protein (DUF1814) [Alteracholeplasma palmae J233]|uniref:Nucleotidyl transferase AbiEii/AbiGii toxin family protein n=1 Tax=Alteracholeplasma palmae (strain ATCC 49389 / J233) TaxID=1318466 RepID=U4KJJ7_ALTPJ|nr:nucleotidyl transferase AbiEii/AbiGii toxin family protein [Alteracholeplasma palmae]CCV63634.1 conserved hypothetical protein (DUF1814) [Alteracholeplasma palmae J233]
MTIIDQMLEKYRTETIEEKKNAIKEIIQEIVLSGLSRTGFFDYAAFYGGTALRIFYGLPRYSEDLDFSLLVPNKTFDLNSYLPSLLKEVSALGLNFEIEEKVKTIDSNIKSAFIKGNTKEQFLTFYPKSNDYLSIINNEKIKVKFEIDINPPKHATTEYKYGLLPYPYEIQIYDMPSLFAGKIHAVLCRAWKNRIKGRDLYDYIFYIGKKTKINMKHLQERLIQSEFIRSSDEFSLEILKSMLKDKFGKIDYNEAKKDVLPFIADSKELTLWTSHFFISITENIEEI